MMDAPEVQTPPPFPRCPHCNTDLDAPALYNWPFHSGPLTQMVLCVYCPNLECRKLLGTQIVMVQAVEQEPRIQRPH